MIDERAYELALSQLAQAREEKMLLFEQVKRLTEEVALLRSSSTNRAEEQSATIKELTAKISELSAQVVSVTDWRHRMRQRDRRKPN